MTKGEFSVCKFFHDDSYEYVRSKISAEEAVKVFKICITSPAARLGMTRRVIVTDGGDSINLEWQFGKGITFDGKQPQPTEQI